MISEVFSPLFQNYNFLQKIYWENKILHYVDIIWWCLNLFNLPIILPLIKPNRYLLMYFEILKLNWTFFCSIFFFFILMSLNVWFFVIMAERQDLFWFLVLSTTACYFMNVFQHFVLHNKMFQPIRLNSKFCHRRISIFDYLQYHYFTSLWIIDILNRLW